MVYIPYKWKLFKFQLSTFICWLYELVATLFLTEFGGWWYAGSYAFALVTSVFFMFYFYVVYVFDISGNAVRRLVNFALVTASVYSASWFLVVLLTEKTNWHYSSSLIVVGLVVSLFSYHLHEYVVFYD